MGLECTGRVRGYWKDFTHVETELRQIIEKEYRDERGNVLKEPGDFPMPSLLRRIGRQDLLGAMANHHGGIQAAQHKMGFRSPRVPRRYWMEFRNVERELREEIGKEYRDETGKVIKPAGEYPTEGALRKLGRFGLVGAITAYHGGIRAVREALGFQSRTRPAGYWKDFGNVACELLEIIQREYRDPDGSIIKAKRSFPTYSELRRLGRYSLVTAMETYYGGYRAVKARMGFGGELPRDSVDAFVKKLRTIKGAEALVPVP